MTYLRIEGEKQRRSVKSARFCRVSFQHHRHHHHHHHHHHHRHRHRHRAEGDHILKFCLRGKPIIQLQEVSLSLKGQVSPWRGKEGAYLLAPRVCGQESEEEVAEILLVYTSIRTSAACMQERRSKHQSPGLFFAVFVPSLYEIIAAGNILFYHRHRGS